MGRVMVWLDLQASPITSREGKLDVKHLADDKLSVKHVYVTYLTLIFPNHIQIFALFTLFVGGELGKTSHLLWVLQFF